MTVRTDTSANTQYNDLLWIDNNGSGLDATLRQVQDGKGAPTPFEMSIYGINVDRSTGYFALDGVQITTAASALNLVGDMSQANVLLTSRTTGFPNGRLLLASTGISLDTSGPDRTTTIGLNPTMSSLAELTGIGIVARQSNNTYAAFPLTSDGSITIQNPSGDGAAPVLNVAPNTTLQKTKVQYNNVEVGIRPTLNFLPGSGIGVTVIDDGSSDRINISLSAAGGGGSVTSVAVASPDGTLDVAGSPITTSGTINLDVRDDTSIQKINLERAGVAVGTQSTLNLIPGSNVSITASNNTEEDRVDVTISSAGGGGGGGAPNEAMYIVAQADEGELPNAISLGSLGAGLLFTSPDDTVPAIGTLVAAGDLATATAGQALLTDGSGNPEGLYWGSVGGNTLVTGQTTSTTGVNLATFTVTNASIVTVRAYVTGFYTDNSEQAIVTEFTGAAIRSDAGTLTFFGYTAINSQSTADESVTAGLDVSSNAFHLRVTGASGKTIKWVASYSTTTVTVA